MLTTSRAHRAEGVAEGRAANARMPDTKIRPPATMNIRLTELKVTPANEALKLRRTVLVSQPETTTEEMDFADEARSWAGIAISEKLPKNGDFILTYRAPNGDPTEPKILIDNKDKSVIAESDVDKLVRDARERSIVVAALVAREESQLRQVDRESRWSRKTVCGCSEPRANGLRVISTCSSQFSTACECMGLT